MKIKVAKKDFSSEIKTPKNAKKNPKEQLKNKVFLSQVVGGKKNSPDTEKRSQLVYLFYFLFVVFVAIGIALIWRAVILYSQNAFTSSSFSVLVQGEDTYIVAVNDGGTVAVIDASLPNIPNEALLKKSFKLGIPLGSQVTVPGAVEPSHLFSYQTAVPAFIGYGGLRFQGLTPFDFFKIASIFSGASSSDVETHVAETEEGKLDLSSEELFLIFKDPQIIEEGLSVEIVNATLTDGLAGKAATVLEPLGINVVSLSSKDPVKTSEIIASKESVTLSRIKQILNIPEKTEAENQIADIKIILGEDFEERVR